MKLWPLLFLILFLSNTGLAKSRKSKLFETVKQAFNEATVSLPTDQEICFSPHEPCDIKLWKFIQSAQKSLDIAIYDITHVKITHEILVASKRIPVRVLVDQRETKDKHSLVDLLVKGGVEVRLGTQRGIMHNKFTIIDGVKLETGSYNYTDGATFKNNENQIYLFTPTVVQKYAKHFDEIWNEGRPMPAKVSRNE